MFRFAAVISLFGLLIVRPLSAQDNPPEPPAAAGATATSGVADHPATKASDYKPPFPERDDLFQPPNYKGLTKSQREEVRLEVALKGFAHMDGDHALLAINGKMVSLSAGESFAGVELISIQEPQVRLKRGRVFWTESLYNTSEPDRRSADVKRAATDTPSPEAASPETASPEAAPATPQDDS